MRSKLKRYIVHLVAGVCYYSGAFRLWFILRHCLRRREICVLGLHRVLSEQQARESNSLGGIVIREQTFAEVLNYLARNFHVVSLDSFLRGSLDDVPKSKPVCLLTFDDGWKDNYTTALPLLKKYNLPAIVFAVTGMIGTDRTFWVEQLIRIWRDEKARPQLKVSLEKALGMMAGADGLEDIVERLKHMPTFQREQILAPFIGAEAALTANGDRMLTWEETASLQQAGIEIEAHTVTHPLLVYEDDAAVMSELQGAKSMLEKKLRKKVRAFAYPNGAWNDRVRGIVKKAGYECAFAGERGWHSARSDPFTIRRILLHERNVTAPDGKFSPAILTLRLSGWI